MKFPVKQTGMRFFFFTFGVEGRREVLSRLVRGEKRPVLSEVGERVREVWEGLHGMEAAFTASEWVLMPDHVHLLLVVRPGAGREVAFNPLVFAHWFLWATETAAGGGTVVGPPGGRWARYVPVGEWPAPGVRLWEREWWVDVALESRQLSAIRRYIRGNVARRWWKVDHPDRFALRRLRHPVLEPAVAWSGMGDATLLSNPFCTMCGCRGRHRRGRRRGMRGLSGASGWRHGGGCRCAGSCRRRSGSSGGGSGRCRVAAGCGWCRTGCRSGTIRRWRIRGGSRRGGCWC